MCKTIVCLFAIMRGNKPNWFNCNR